VLKCNEEIDGLGPSDFSRLRPQVGVRRNLECGSPRRPNSKPAKLSQGTPSIFFFRRTNPRRLLTGPGQGSFSRPADRSDPDDVRHGKLIDLSTSRVTVWATQARCVLLDHSAVRGAHPPPCRVGRFDALGLVSRR